MTAGFVQIPREILEALETDGPALQVYCHIARRASWRPIRAYTQGRGYVDLETGEALTSLQELADATGITVKRARGAVARLERDGFVQKRAHLWAQSRAHRGTILRVLPSGTSADLGSAKGTVMGTAQDRGRAHLGHTSGTPPPGSPKESSDCGRSIRSRSVEGKIEERSRADRGRSAVPEEAMQLAAYLRDRITRNGGRQVPRDDAELARWATEIERAQRLDGFSWTEIRQAIDFSQADQFWSLNIRSGAKLRQQMDRLLGEGKLKGSRDAAREADAAQQKRAHRAQSRPRPQIQVPSPPASRELALQAVGQILADLHGDSVKESE